MNSNPLSDILPEKVRKVVYAAFLIAGIVVGALNAAGVDVGTAMDVLAYLTIPVGALAVSNTGQSGDDLDDYQGDDDNDYLDEDDYEGEAQADDAYDDVAQADGGVYKTQPGSGNPSDSGEWNPRLPPAS